MENEALPKQPGMTVANDAGKGAPFGVNEVRLNLRQWFATLVIVVLVGALTPWVWGRIERFNTGPDYRLPYQLSKDYWLYGQWMSKAVGPGKIILLGDSVVWGEYVAPEGTLSHFLNQQTGAADQFVNGGLNGLFPLAEEGLVAHHSGALRRHKVILHCNVLWLTSPKADLSTGKKERFNHAGLVPQFFPRIPCYRADANERMSAVVQREVSLFSWVGHLQDACFGQKSILAWTLEDDGGNPPLYPHAWKNPFAQITLTVPSAPGSDPERGPGSPRHRPWNAEGQDATRFDWVELDSSLQWRAFQRMIGTLRARGNDVLVVLGPFNEHLMAEGTQPAYRKIRDGITAWLDQNGIAHVLPETLPSELYADASHPLTQGYELLAKRLYSDQTFRNWLAAGR